MGRKRKAAMVIWGAYDDFGVTPRVELLRQPVLQEETTLPQRVLNTVKPAIAGSAKASPSRTGNLSLLTRAPLATVDLDLFAAYGPEQITYAVAAILATGLYADGQYADSLALFDKSLANASAGGSAISGLERVHFQRAVTLHALGRAAEATADLKKAVEIDPAFMEAHYNLAIAYADGCAGPDGLTLAVAEAETAVRLKPDDAKAHRLLGSLYQQANRNQDALAELQKALSTDSRDPLTYQLLAAVQAALGNDAESSQASQQAMTLIQAALADHGKTADAYTLQLTLGDVYVGASQYPPAIAAYQAAARLRPDAAAPHRGLGNVYFWQDQLDQALAEYQQAAALAPQIPAAPLLTGLIQAQSGDLTGAIASQETAARLSQCDPAPHLLLGGLYFEQNDVVKAAAAYEAALALDSTNADTWYVLAGLRYELEDLAAAAQAAQEAVTREPDMVEAQRLLGRARLNLGDAKGALPAAQALVRLAPQDADAHALLGDVYFDLQQWQDAAPAYEAALALQDDASTRVAAGMARQQLGEVDAAIAHYQAALDLRAGQRVDLAGPGRCLRTAGPAGRGRGRLREGAGYRGQRACPRPVGRHLPAAGRCGQGHRPIRAGGQPGSQGAALSGAARRVVRQPGRAGPRRGGFPDRVGWRRQQRRGPCRPGRHGLSPVQHQHRRAVHGHCGHPGARLSHPAARLVRVSGPHRRRRGPLRRTGQSPGRGLAGPPDRGRSPLPQRPMG